MAKHSLVLCPSYKCSIQNFMCILFESPRYVLDNRHVSRRIIRSKLSYLKNFITGQFSSNFKINIIVNVKLYKDKMLVCSGVYGVLYDLYL